MTRQHAAITAILVCMTGVAASAEAGIVHHTSLLDGTNSANFTIDGIDVTITSQGGNFKKKTVAGFAATGVANGIVDGEIDHEESILITFSAPVHITLLSFAHLFNAGNYGDAWDEVAEFRADNTSFTFESTEPTSGVWSGLGVVVNESPAIDNHGGAWTIAGADIFGGPITSLKLKSGNPGTLPKYGDYGFRQLGFNVVPTPGALALLAAAGLIGVRRRRSA